MSNITQVVNVDKNMTTLKKGVIASGLDQVLSSTGPFTVFAPSDRAFGKLDKSILDNLLKPENKTKLVELLNHHVVAGKVSFKDLKDGEKLKTVDGSELLVHIKDGSVNINGAKIEQHDVQTSNGVIHSLDTVMLRN
ncbi:MAG: fasciclin domain-containing protein [Puia sp.]|nr:fasciclin domain-containing protein [Puia sp.]